MLLKFGVNYVNIGDARSLYDKPDDKGRPQVEVVWHNGVIETFAGGRIEDVEAQCGTIVPAAAGFKLTEQSAGPVPVVAFRIAGERTIPITLLGEPKSATWTMTTPDGASFDAVGAVVHTDKPRAAKQLAQAAE